MFYTDHQALKFVQSQANLNSRHATWIEFLQRFDFFIKHKAGSSNVVADSLSRRNSMLATMHHHVIGFNDIRTLYKDDPDFKSSWEACLSRDGVYQDLVIHNEYLFKGEACCIPLRLSL